MFLVVRCCALRADPPSWLSWSAGIRTDEGFYTLDARSEVLFGHWAIGNFHDRLLSPLLSVLQQGVFTVFGPELWAARLLSISFSLLTLCLFWLGLKHWIGENAADAGAIFLGLAPPFVFYNRLALQETPTVFWLVFAFAAWSVSSDQPNATRRALLGILSGASLAVALMFKPLAAIALPAFAYLYWTRREKDSDQHRIFAVAAFFLLVGCYGAVWYGPHAAEIQRMTTFYRVHQMQPHSAKELLLNLRRGFLGGPRGVLPYLLALLPTPCVLAAVGVAWFRALQPAQRQLVVFFSVWLVAGLVFCFVSSYAPSRYYVLFLPALLGLSALGWTAVSEKCHRTLFVLFLLTILPWYVVSLRQLSYSRYLGSQELARRLAKGSVVIGEFAPALCLDTQFADAPVQPGLSNDIQPVERLRPTYVTVDQTPFWEDWWKSHYPALIHPENKVITLRLSGGKDYEVAVYRVL